MPFLQQHKDELKCDVIAVSDTGMVAQGVPTMGYGLRGIACCEVTVKGPSGDLHSGVYGGAVANPATAVARLVASLHDAEGNIAIEGFYDEVRPLEQWERDMWADVPGMTEQDMLAITGSPALFGEPAIALQSGSGHAPPLRSTASLVVIKVRDQKPCCPPRPWPSFPSAWFQIKTPRTSWKKCKRT